MEECDIGIYCVQKITIWSMLNINGLVERQGIGICMVCRTGETGKIDEGIT